MKSEPENNVADPAIVSFSHSKRRTVWTYYDGTLRDLAERCVVGIARDCGDGNCGLCRALISGKVEFVRSSNIELPQGEYLLCCCEPRGREVTVAL